MPDAPASDCSVLWWLRADNQSSTAAKRWTSPCFSAQIGAGKALSSKRAANSGGIFHGQSAVERMTFGSIGDLYVVRRYLDAQCC